MPKKISEIQKRDIIDEFTNGKTIDYLAEKYKITKVTVTRHLKIAIDDKKFKSLLKNNIKYKREPEIDIKEKLNYDPDTNKEVLYEQTNLANRYVDNSFVEITPLNFEIDNEVQKDLSSVSIDEIEFPKIVYMIVDNKIELETKLLKDYPEWQFLSQTELSRKTIAIYFDVKNAKRICNKEQRVIKVPNTNVFSIVAPILVSRGISRIVCPDKLIAL